VQGTDEPVTITPEEFESVLHMGVSSCATGVMMFTLHGITGDSAKLDVMKRVYQEWKTK
jgi:hypothetical protein